MTHPMPPIPDTPAADAQSAAEASDTPWLVALLGVTLLLALFIWLALIAA